MTAIKVHPDVEDALLGASPVVVLESAVLTTGLPNRPWDPSWDVALLEEAVPGWNPAAPLGAELWKRMEEAIRKHGATPCSTGVVDGCLHLGLDESIAMRLAEHGAGNKVNSTTMAIGMGTQQCAGTTVSATLSACRLLLEMASHEHWAPVLATGGIGGVHRRWTERLDISADLLAMASTRACVVASGCKSILDMTATLEFLETLSVPVLGWDTDRWPSFTSASPASNPPINSIDDMQQLGRICSHHWHDLGAETAVLLANPLDASLALDPQEMDSHVEEAEAAATREGMDGVDRTPHVLEHIADSTQGRSVAANLALLLSNADRAAEAACMLAGPHLVRDTEA